MCPPPNPFSGPQSWPRDLPEHVGVQAGGLDAAAKLAESTEGDTADSAENTDMAREGAAGGGHRGPWDEEPQSDRAPARLTPRPLLRQNRR